MKITVTYDYNQPKNQYKVFIRERDEKGHIKSSVNRTVSSWQEVEKIRNSAKTSSNISQFRKRSGKYNQILNSYLTLGDNVISASGGIPDKYKAMFMWVMNKIGPNGLNKLYKKDKMLISDGYKSGSPGARFRDSSQKDQEDYSNDDFKTNAEKWDEKFNDLLPGQEFDKFRRAEGTQWIKNFIRLSGYSEEEILQELEASKQQDIENGMTHGKASSYYYYIENHNFMTNKYYRRA